MAVANAQGSESERPPSLSSSIPLDQRLSRGARGIHEVFGDGCNEGAAGADPFVECSFVSAVYKYCFPGFPLVIREQTTGL